MQLGISCRALLRARVPAGTHPLIQLRLSSLCSLRLRNLLPQGEKGPAPRPATSRACAPAPCCRSATCRTVGDNVGYALDIARVEKAERNQRVGAALELVGLTGLENRKPRQSRSAKRCAPICVHATGGARRTRSTRTARRAASRSRSICGAATSTRSA